MFAVPLAQQPRGDLRQLADIGQVAQATTAIPVQTDADVLEPLELGFGFCRLVVASPEGLERLKP